MNPKKRPSKTQREIKILIECVEHYIRTGRPVGSHALKGGEAGELSSATIRNYFSSLEEEGYLLQQHTSGGRIPTDRAFRLYLNHLLDDQLLFDHLDHKKMGEELEIEEKNFAPFLQKGADWLAKQLGVTLFISSPRFEQDFLVKIKLLPLSHERALFALLTQFGEVFTEILPIKEKISSLLQLRMTAYFDWRMRGGSLEECPLKDREAAFGEELYQELILRFLVRHSTFEQEEIFRSGFSNLLRYPEFQDPLMLVGALSLFENRKKMKQLIREAVVHKKMVFWLGSDLSLIQEGIEKSSFLMLPYRIGFKIAGVIGVLGPMRMDYKKILSLLIPFGDWISKALTEAVSAYRLSFRVPSEVHPHLLDVTEKILLEDKRNL